MRVEKLILVGYKRMQLNAIREFEYTPTADFQLILGTNGCGKSSLISELTPLPGDHKQYHKGGRKEIHVSHGRYNYVCTSNFNGGTGKHSFLRNGVEMNPGGTPTVQRELCLQEFKLDQELHDLLTGKVKFTQMRVQDIRHWITKLSSADYSYVLAYYKRVTTNLRDAQANVKQHREKILADTNKLLGIEDAEGLEERITHLSTELNHLFKARIPNLPGRNEAQYKLNWAMDRMRVTSENILKAKLFAPAGMNFTTLEDIDAKVVALDGEVRVSEALVEHSTRQYADLDDIIRALAESGVENAANLKDVEARLSSDIMSRESTQRLLVGPFAQEVMDNYLTVQNDLIELFDTIPANVDGNFSRTGMEQARTEHANLTRENQGLDFQATSAANRASMIRAAKDSICPKCGYVWKEGLSEDELDHLDLQIAQLNVKIGENEEKMRWANEYISTAELIMQGHHRFRSIKHTYPQLNKLWDYMIDNQMLANPTRARQVLVTAASDLHTGITVHASRLEREHVRDALKKIELTGGADDGHYSQRLAELEKSISQETTKLSQNRGKLSRMRSYQGEVRQAQEAILELATLMREAETALDTLTNVDMVATIDEVSRGHQQQLSALQRKLTEVTTLRVIIQDREKDLDNLIKRQEALKIIDEELSPKSGLIASLVIGFINSITEHLNEVIDSIWTHDLIVLPCSMDDGDLDYKFPFTVNTSDQPIPHVSEGSDGQMEIFDFAFKLTAMVYLELEDYPLFLDELGRTFDESHRVNLMMFLKNVVDARTITQVFMSSHYAPQYKAMASAEVLVLDPTNIVVPDVHNTHVIMR